MEYEWAVDAGGQRRYIKGLWCGLLVSPRCYLYYGTYVALAIVLSLVLSLPPVALAAMIVWVVVGITAVTHLAVRRLITKTYPVGFVARSVLSPGGVRVVTALSAYEIAWERMGRPRAYAGALTFLSPLSRSRRMGVPRALAPDEAVAGYLATV